MRHKCSRSCPCERHHRLVSPTCLIIGWRHIRNHLVHLEGFAHEVRELPFLSATLFLEADEIQFELVELALLRLGELISIHLLQKVCEPKVRTSASVGRLVVSGCRATILMGVRCLTRTWCDAILRK